MAVFLCCLRLCVCKLRLQLACVADIAASLTTRQRAAEGRTRGSVLPLLRLAVGVTRRVDETRVAAALPRVDVEALAQLHDVKVDRARRARLHQTLQALHLCDDLPRVLDDKAALPNGLPRKDAVPSARSAGRQHAVAFVEAHCRSSAPRARRQVSARTHAGGRWGTLQANSGQDRTPGERLLLA